MYFDQKIEISCFKISIYIALYADEVGIVYFNLKLGRE